MGRKVQTTQQINGGQQVTISQATYNDVGQLLTKNLGGGLQTIGYSYNERGWMTAASAPLFAMSLQYNSNSLNTTGFIAQYNGNIATQNWGTPGNLTKSYTYSYDNLNRLKAGNSSASYSENNISYDPLGNLTSLTRTNGANAGTYTYHYTGNQLQSVTGLTSSNYSYDLNGNVQNDARTNNTITYNYLNLPQQSTGSNPTTYLYDATGKKLRKIYGPVTTDYIDGIQYDNNIISFIQTEEGRALNNSGTYVYEYTLADHLGNSRISFDQNSATTIRQQDDYYPFGLVSNSSTDSPPNKYLYNKKEVQETGDLDYGARFYDPVIGRWSSVDPLAEVSRRWTSYNYVYNNPIRMVDPDGLQGILCQYPKLFAKLKMAKADGSYIKKLAKLERTQLLILDDFGIQPFDAQSRAALMELIEDRHGKTSLIIISQLPASKWFEVIGEKTVADAIMDRIVNDAHRIELRGGIYEKKT